MADKLTAAQLAECGVRNIRIKVGRYATIDNGAISSTGISSRIKKWGGVTFEVYNKHPNERGRLRFPIMNLEADNHDGYFNLGGVLFPNGKSDFADTAVRVQAILFFTSASSLSVLDFTGRLKEPEYDNTGVITLVVEHVLTSLSLRKWRRADRIGGDTGINKAFGS